MTANLLLLLLTIQTGQVWPYTVMPDNSSEMVRDATETDTDIQNQSLGTCPVIHLSFDSNDGMTLHGAEGVVCDEERGEVFSTGGLNNWADLGDMSRACITIPETCENGGTLMVRIKVLSSEQGGYLTTVSRIPDPHRASDDSYSGGIFIEGKGGLSTTFLFLTSGGTYQLQNDTLDMKLDRWYRITMVYDPKSASGDHSGNMVYVNNKMYSAPLVDFRQHRQGTGQMVLGRSYTDYTHRLYANVLIDDLKMWNRMLTHEEIIKKR